MNQHNYILDNYILDAIETVSAWDIDDEEDFAQAVNDQAKLMAGIDPEEIWEETTLN